MEELSRKRVVNRHLDLVSDVSSEFEEVRVLLDSGSVAESASHNHFNDESGAPVPSGTALYKVRPFGYLMSGQSCFRCMGCYAYFPLIMGKEVEAAENHVTHIMDGSGTPPPDSAGASSAQQPVNVFPGKGFCPDCWKHERRARIKKAIVDFFLSPVKAMFPRNVEGDQAVEQR